ncbi:MAG: hypothetical protein IKD85_00935 [Firmicutes bacterium]|jgi:hypothetical protein|nr:hypothetical protein [Bacillota bacterium]
MIDDKTRRVLRHLWETEDERICTATWRTTLTPEEEALVFEWDEQLEQARTGFETVYNDLDDEDIAAMEMEARGIMI